MARDDLSDAWAKKLEDGKPSAPDASAEALRRAMQINPSLAQSLQGGEKGKAKKSVAETLVVEKQKYQAERKRIKDEIAKLQQSERTLLSKTLDKVLDAIVDNDPELKDKATETALKTETLFLSEIGFSKAKIALHRQKRK